MPLVTTAKSNLIGGVSQQDDAVRLPDKAKEVVNCYSDLVDGLIKRHPTQHLAELDSSDLDGAKIHAIDRDDTEKYIMVIADNSLEVFDADDGTSYTVNDPGSLVSAASGYFNIGASNAEEVFKCLTIADTTFIVNTDVEVDSNSGSTTPAQPTPDGDTYYHLIFVNQGAFGTKYQIGWTEGATSYYVRIGTQDGSGDNQGTPQGSVDDPENGADPEYIASRLAYAINNMSSPGIAGTTSHGTSGQWSGTATAYGSVVLMTRTSTDFAIDYVRGGPNDEWIVSIRDEVKRFTDLPTSAVDGMIVKVSSDTNNDADDFWVKFVALNSSAAETVTNGYWEESVQPGIIKDWDAATLPVIVTRTFNGATPEFDVSRPSWNSRLVGDDNSNPFPSLEGNTISDITFFKNRLVLLSDDNVTMSQVGEYYNLFLTATREVLDDDPIDVSIPHTKVSFLYHAIPYNERLLLFSDSTQFVLGSAGPLTPETVEVTPVMEFENTISTAPVATGRTVVFASEQGQYTLLWEAYQLADGQSYDAVNITAEVPKYVTGTQEVLAADSRTGLLVTVPKTKGNTVFVYRSFWDGQQKVLSAWSKWEFGDDSKVLSAAFIQDDLYFIIARPSTSGTSTFLEKMELGSGRTDTGQDWFTAIDRRVDEDSTGVSIAYDQDQDISTITMPYELEDGATWQVCTRNDTTESNNLGAGLVVAVVTSGDTTIEVRGDYRNVGFYAGQKYTMSYTFSRPQVRIQSETGGFIPPAGSKQRVNRGIISHNATANYTVDITIDDRAYQYSYQAPPMDEEDDATGLVLRDGVFRFPVRSEPHRVSVVVSNDTPLPSNLVGVEWDILLNSRTRR